MDSNSYESYKKESMFTPIYKSLDTLIKAFFKSKKDIDIKFGPKNILIINEKELQKVKNNFGNEEIVYFPNSIRENEMTLAVTHSNSSYKIYVIIPEYIIKIMQERKIGKEEMKVNTIHELVHGMMEILNYNLSKRLGVDKSVIDNILDISYHKKKVEDKKFIFYLDEILAEMTAYLLYLRLYPSKALHLLLKDIQNISGSYLGEIQDGRIISYITGKIATLYYLFYQLGLVESDKVLSIDEIEDLLVKLIKKGKEIKEEIKDAALGGVYKIGALYVNSLNEIPRYINNIKNSSNSSNLQIPLPPFYSTFFNTEIDPIITSAMFTIMREYREYKKLEKEILKYVNRYR